MKIKQTLLTTLAVVTLGVSAQALTITFQENGSSLNLGSSSTFLNAVTAYANPGNLYSKNDGVGEAGLGIAGTTDNEIDPNHTVTIVGINGFLLDSISLGSVQAGELGYVFWANTLGGALTAITTFTADGSYDISGYAGKYIVVQGGGTGGQNVVLGSVTGHFNTPDGASTALLLGSALSGLGLLRRKFMA